jgi:hypothetical protein
MIKKLILVPVIASVITASHAQHVYMMNYKELTQYAKEAREPAYESFVEYLNGDTLKGADLKKQHNYLNGKEKWAMNGIRINLDSVMAYQDEDCLRLVRHDTSGYKEKYLWQIGKKAQPNIVVSEFTRIFRGKINLYADQVDNSRTTTTYNSNTNSYQSTTTGGVHTSFYLGRGDQIRWVTLESLKNEMQDCSAALTQIDQEFKETYWYKHPKGNINDYRALIRICEVYNKCK